ncbi:unnamed protein product [Closterium sp. NIES-65]|nr:unnamed protein product [Closterium sp. NIES-65]
MRVYRCFQPDPGIGTAALGACEAAALGASASVLSGTGETALSGTASSSSSLTFTLDSGASRSFFRDRTTLTPLGRPVAVSLADPSGGPVLSHFSTVLPCPAALRAPCRVAASGQVLAAASRSGPSCVPCVEGRLRATPHSSHFPPTEAPLQTLHMDVWGPAPVRGQGYERYFLLVVDDYSRYHSPPLHSKGAVTEVLIDWIREARLQLRKSFGSDFPFCVCTRTEAGVLFSPSAGLLSCTGGIRQTFTLPDSPQQNGIACERRIGMVMDVARTSMMHAAAPIFCGRLRVAVLPPLSRRVVFLSQDVTFDESVPFYRLFPYRTPSLPPPPDFLTPLTRSRLLVTLVLLRVLSLGVLTLGVLCAGVLSLGVLTAGGAGPEGATAEGAKPGGLEPGGAVPGGAGSGDAGSGAAEPGGAELGAAEPGDAASGAAEPGVSPAAASRREPLSPQELREWFARRWRRAAESGGAAGAGAGASSNVEAPPESAPQAQHPQQAPESPVTSTGSTASTWDNMRGQNLRWEGVYRGGTAQGSRGRGEGRSAVGEEAVEGD